MGAVIRSEWNGTLTIDIRPMCEDNVDIIKIESFEGFLCAFDNAVVFKVTSDWSSGTGRA